jgi:hypothetical protein
VNYKGVQGVLNPLQEIAYYSMLLRQPKGSTHQSKKETLELRPYRQENQNQEVHFTSFKSIDASGFPPLKITLFL